MSRSSAPGPIYFENGVTELNEAARHNLDGPFLWYRHTEGAGDDVFIILRTYTNGEPASDLARLSEARAEAVRTALIARHVLPGHILISHTFSGEPRYVENWVGGWIYPEYYLSRAVRDRLFPPGGAVC